MLAGPSALLGQRPTSWVLRHPSPHELPQLDPAGRLEGEQGALGGQAADVAAHAAIGADHPVAGDQHRQRVGRAGAAHRPDGLGVARREGERGVGGGAAVADLGQVLQHDAAEPGGQPPVQGDVEPVAPSGEVLVQLPGHAVQAARGLQQPGAHPVGEALQHDVVVLDGVGQPDDAVLGGGDQQGADGAVDGAVRDVQRAVGAGGLDQPGVQGLEPAGSGDEGLGEGAGQVVGCGGHVGPRFVYWRRRLAIPSAAARRAASGLPPTRAATSA